MKSWAARKAEYRVANVAAFAEEWLQSRLVERQTLRRDRGIVRRHLVPAFRSSLLYTITPQQVAVCIAGVANVRSTNTARRVYAVLHKMLEDAKAWRYVSENAVATMPAPGGKKTLRRVPFRTVDELCAAIAAVPAAWRAHVFVLMLTGLRWGEFVAVQWKDLNLDASKMTVCRSIPVGNHEPKAPKSGAQRVVDLLPPVQRLFMDLPQRGSLVFPGAHGGRLNHGYFYRHVWRPSITKAKLELRIHDLRHAYTSLLLAFGDPILYVSRQIGHSSAKLTLDTYGHLVEEGHALDRETTLRKLEEALHGAVRVLSEPGVREEASAERLDETGAGDRTRTDDLRITSALLYH